MNGRRWQSLAEAFGHMPRWFTREEVEHLKETFTYHIQ
jgi:hypothetical protein